jgi:DinB superfamily
MEFGCGGKMSRALSICALVLAACSFALPAIAQDSAKKAEALKPVPSPSQAVLAQWNEIGRKILAIAEDLPENKYDYKPHPDSRTFVAQILHVSASMYYFTDVAEGRKVRYGDDPSRDQLKTKPQVVAFVKKCVEDGANLIKARGDTGMTAVVQDPESNQKVRVSELAYSVIEHSGEHYGQLVVYYRINGMVPPESRPRN